MSTLNDAWIKAQRERHAQPTEERRRQLQAEVDALTAQLAAGGAGPVSPTALDAAAADCEALTARVAELQRQMRAAVDACLADCAARLASNDAKVHVEALRGAEDFFDRPRDELVQTSLVRLEDIIAKKQSTLDDARAQLGEIAAEAHSMVAAAAKDFQRHKALSAEQQRLNLEIKELRHQLQLRHGGIPETVLDAWSDIGAGSTLIDECVRLTNDARLEGTWNLDPDVLERFRISTGQRTGS